LLEASNCWAVNIDNGLIDSLIFIDLKKAFDTIDHKILLRKLASYGIDHRSLKWFDSYLSDRQQKCVVNELSGARAVTCGVPQGSLIGPRPLSFFSILGDPRATSRDDAIFSGERHFWRESLFQGLKSLWALFLTQRVPEVSKSVPLIGQKIIFLANQRGDLAR